MNKFISFFAVTSIIFMFNVNKSDAIEFESKDYPTSSKDSPKKNQKEIPLNKDKGRSEKRDRNFGADVSAYVSSQTWTLYVYLYDTGETNIYIVNSKNELVSEDTYHSDYFPVARISLPEIGGKYWVIITSEYIYAEGLFTK